MERRFQLALLSMSEIANHGKGFESKLMDNLPEGTNVIAKSNDMVTGSLQIVLHNEAWDVIPNGEELPKVLVELGALCKPVSSIIALPS